MTEAYAYSYFDSQTHPLPIVHPLQRRMSPLQKAVLGAYHQLLQNFSFLLNEAEFQQAPIYFTSCSGEQEALQSCNSLIEQKAWPLSPKDFQHSVLNASLAYLSMVYQLHQPSFAFYEGYLGTDHILKLCDLRLRHKLDSCLILVHGEEGSATAARAEVLVIGQKSQAEGLKLVLSKQEESPSDALIFDEASLPLSLPFFGSAEGLYRSRKTKNLSGETYSYEWLPSTSDNGSSKPFRFLGKEE